MSAAEIQRAIEASLRARHTELSEKSVEEANRLVEACCIAIDPDGRDLEAVKAQLAQIHGGGYGPWRDAVADAILDADIPEGPRSLIYGAFRMAEAVIDGRQPSPDTPDPAAEASQARIDAVRKARLERDKDFENDDGRGM